MTALLNYELRITMATNFTSRKIEMICGRKMEVKTEIEMSPEVKSLLESDPKAAAQFRDVVEAIEAERRAEMEQKMKPAAKTEESDSDDEDEVREDRWNSPLPGREAKCVNLIKEIVAELKSSIPRVIGEYKGIYITAAIDHSGDEFTRTEINKFGFAFNAWLILNEHKLDGLGGNWCSGCFGSFWADIALTIPNCAGEYYGCRVSFNPEPVKGKQSYFVVDIQEKLKTYNPLKMLLPSTACFPEYGVQRDWGMMLADNAAEREKSEKAEKERIEAERQAKKEEKAAKLRAENEQRRKEEEERKAKFAAERALIEQQAAAQREAELAAKVAALAEQEKAAKEQARLAKLEQARISEEKAKLKAQQKEAERLAKFGNKKK